MTWGEPSTNWKSRFIKKEKTIIFSKSLFPQFSIYILAMPQHQDPNREIIYLWRDKLPLDIAQVWFSLVWTDYWHGHKHRSFLCLQLLMCPFHHVLQFCNFVHFLWAQFLFYFAGGFSFVLLSLCSILFIICWHLWDPLLLFITCEIGIWFVLLDETLEIKKLV